MKSFFDFSGRTEIEKYSRLPRNAETGDSDKEALFASAVGVEVSEFLGGETRQATRGARRCSWTKKSASASVSPDKRWSWTLILVQKVSKI
ncbi:hypothetical protein [Bacillus sp. ISL-37]|uniref:hypothetical protein n=1 Tax=Bacillus sp. ISL-37 TaxID=2819123 RepID=UPI001BEB4E5B|nr:hypothetical protein [Bacillus sp. ISL-37]MBT2685679.1 hypothetical protein [Bacillus sp. ISL-37]